MLERDIERKVSTYAVSLGWESYKFSSPSQRGVPDRLYLRAGKVIFIEFKAAGKQPTKLQKYIHKRIETQGFTVHVIDNVIDGKKVFTNEN